MNKEWKGTLMLAYTVGLEKFAMLENEWGLEKFIDV